jgi:hypothetical protein
MEKVTYASLKLKNKIETEKFDFDGHTIEVLQYLPIEDKYSLINITLQKAKEGSIYNPVKIDHFFHLNLIYMYSNITFTDKQREDEAKLYDTLVSNGLMDAIISKIPDNEYQTLFGYIGGLIDDTLNYKNSLSGTLSELVQSLPERAEQMQKIVDNFDKEKYQEVINFAKAANGGRDI